jgi:hypothetical protein
MLPAVNCGNCGGCADCGDCCVGVGAALIVVWRVVVSVVAGWLAHEISIMASAENTEVRIISFFIVCVVGFGKKVVLRSIHSYRIGKVIFQESDLARRMPGGFLGREARSTRPF